MGAWLAEKGPIPGAVLFTEDGQAEDSAKALRRIRSKYPTGAVARLDLNVEDWRNVGAGSAVSVRFKRPKDLPNAEERGL
jgi:phosphohistidine phosphatase